MLTPEHVVALKEAINDLHVKSMKKRKYFIYFYPDFTALMHPLKHHGVGVEGCFEKAHLSFCISSESCAASSQRVTQIYSQTCVTTQLLQTILFYTTFFS